MGFKRLKFSISDGNGGSRARVKVANEVEKNVPVISSSGKLKGKLMMRMRMWKAGTDVQFLKHLAEKSFWLDTMITLMKYIRNHCLNKLRLEILEFVELKREKLIGASIHHMFEDDETGGNIWRDT